MNFNFKKYGDIYRPVIPIRLENEGQSVQYEVLVDSGADLCIFNAYMAGIVGIDLTKIEPEYISTVAGTSHFYMHEVTIKIGDVSKTIKAGFIEGMANSYGIVGMKGFFDSFIITFDQPKKEVRLKTIDN